MGKREKNALTKLELQIMQVIWRRGPSNVSSVQEGLEQSLAYTTVQTMLNILERKGKLKRELEGRAYVYTAKVTEAKALGQQLRDLVDRMFGGSSEELVMSLLKTRQIDGVVTESSTVLRLVEEGTGRILVRFGDRIPDFHVHVIFARKGLVDGNPEVVRRFLAAWFESVQYMRDHRDETIAIAIRVAEVSKSVATANYDELMPVFNRNGRFDAKALEVLARSFVEMGALPEKPDMSKLYTEAFLPKN